MIFTSSVKGIILVIIMYRLDTFSLTGSGIGNMV